MTPRLLVKPGVTFISPPTAAGFRILGTLERATRECVHRDLIVTCGSDSHGPDDPHSHGDAVDAGTLGLGALVAPLSPAEVLALYDWLQWALETKTKPDFLVLFESPKPLRDPSFQPIWYDGACTGEHIHVQANRGGAYRPLVYPTP